MMQNKTDKKGYDEHYKGQESLLIECNSCDEYIEQAKQRLLPFYRSGNTKGYVRGLAIESMIQAVNDRNLAYQKVCILDAGSGQGELSVLLACLGFKVVGVDISVEARRVAIKLAKKVGVVKNCTFLAESLEDVSLEDGSIDYVIGHASLHHFIKYEGVPDELKRIIKPEGEMFFADSFGENKVYHLFHNKEQMKRLGDVILTKKLIDNYFDGWVVDITPTDWFVMLDKLLLKLFPMGLVQKLSFIWWHLDNLIPRNRYTLFFSGSIMTRVSKIN